MAAKINSIDGKVIVNDGKSLKSILKRTCTAGKTGSFKLPYEVGSGSLAPANASNSEESEGMFGVEGSYTNSSHIAAYEKSCDGRDLTGNYSHDVTLKATPSQHDVQSFVATDLVEPVVDTSNNANLPKVQVSSAMICVNLHISLTLENGLRRPKTNKNAKKMLFLCL